jgi:predicted flavoprotein YhiN
LFLVSEDGLTDSAYVNDITTSSSHNNEGDVGGSTDTDSDADTDADGDAETGSRGVAGVVRGTLSRRFWQYVLWKADVDPELRWDRVTKAQILQICNQLTAGTHAVSGTLGYRLVCFWNVLHLLRPLTRMNIYTCLSRARAISG